MLSIVAFVYNKNIYLSINKTFYKLLINYISNFANIFVDKLLTKKIFLAIEQIKLLQNIKKYLKELQVVVSK